MPLGLKIKIHANGEVLEGV